MRIHFVVVAVLGTETVKVGEGSVRISRAEKQAKKLAPFYLPAVVSIMPEASYHTARPW